MRWFTSAVMISYRRRGYTPLANFCVPVPAYVIYHKMKIVCLKKWFEFMSRLYLMFTLLFHHLVGQMAQVDVQFTILVQYSYNNATLADPILRRLRMTGAGVATINKIKVFLRNSNTVLQSQVCVLCYKLHMNIRFKWLKSSNFSRKCFFSHRILFFGKIFITRCNVDEVWKGRK